MPGKPSKKIPILIMTILIASLYGTTIFAQQDGDDIVIGKYRNIQSQILGEERTISVYLPASYENGTDRYPVMYILDGFIKPRFMAAISTMEDLDEKGALPQMIVIGIDAPNSLRDYFPQPLERHPGSGQADNFLKFISEELIPWVEQNYRTGPYRILFGASNSGMFTVYAFLKNPGVFSAYIASSPSIGWFKDFMVDNMIKAFSGENPPMTTIYMNYGTDDIESIVLSAMPALEETFSTYAPEDLQWTLEVIEGGGHVPNISFLNGLGYVIPDWKYPADKLTLNGLEGLQKHAAQLTKKYGFNAKIPSGLLMDLGYDYFNASKWDKAIEVFRVYAKNYPKSHQPYYFLGEISRQKGEIKKAREYFEKTLEVSPDFAPARQKLDELNG